MLSIGHRGAAGHAPENTLRSFQKALELGVDMVELDVHASRDGELVVIHDPRLERVTNGKGHVHDYTMDELQKLDAGSGEKIPTLHEVYDLIGGRAHINVEMKGPGLEEKLVQFIRQRNAAEQTLVSSFHQQALYTIKHLDEHVKTGLLFYGVPLQLSALLSALKVHSYHPDDEFLQPSAVLIAHVVGCQVYPYTVNDPERMKTLRAWGVDGIISDYPDRIKGL